MISSTGWQYFGSALTLIFGLVLAAISRHSQTYIRYGREALLCSAAYVISVAALRALATSGNITSETARAINGVTAACALAILLQIFLLRRKENTLASPNN